MLLFKRLVTTVVLFALLFVAVWLGTIMVGAAIVSAQAVIAEDARNPGHPVDQAQGMAIGQRAGAEFGRKYSAAAALGALVVAGILAPGLSFSGALVWCRRKPGE